MISPRIHRVLRWFSLFVLMFSASRLALAQSKEDPDKLRKDSTAQKGSSDTKDPAEPKETNLARAFRLFQENKGEDAVKALQEAIKDDPTIGTPRLQIVRWLVQAGKGQEARAQLEIALAESPGHPVCYLVNGSIALAENRIAETILNLERAQQLILIPGWPAGLIKHVNDESLNGLAVAYERRNDWAQVKNYLQQLDRNNPANPQILLRLARACFQLDQAEDALRYLESAYAKDKGMDPPELILAQFYAMRGTDEKARKNTEEAYQKAKEKYDATAAMSKGKEEREKAARVYRSEAEWRLSLGQIQAAQSLVKTVKMLDPDSRETLAVQGLLLRYEGKPAEAARMFEEALRKSPSFAYAMAHLAVALCQSDSPTDRSRGKEYAEQYQKQNPQNPDAYAVLGYCYLRQDPPMLDQADQALGIRLQAGAISPDTAYYIALLLNKREKYDQAADILEKTLEKNSAFIFRNEAQDLLAKTKPLVKKTESSGSTSTSTPKK